MALPPGFELVEEEETKQPATGLPPGFELVAEAAPAQPTSEVLPTPEEIPTQVSAEKPPVIDTEPIKPSVFGDVKDLSKVKFDEQIISTPSGPAKAFSMGKGKEPIILPESFEGRLLSGSWDESLSEKAIDVFDRFATGLIEGVTAIDVKKITALPETPDQQSVDAFVDSLGLPEDKKLNIAGGLGEFAGLFVPLGVYNKLKFVKKIDTLIDSGKITKEAAGFFLKISGMGVFGSTREAISQLTDKTKELNADEIATAGLEWAAFEGAFEALRPVLAPAFRAAKSFVGKKILDRIKNVDINLGISERIKSERLKTLNTKQSLLKKSKNDLLKKFKQQESVVAAGKFKSLSAEKAADDQLFNTQRGLVRLEKELATTNAKLKSLFNQEVPKELKPKSKSTVPQSTDAASTIESKQNLNANKTRLENLTRGARDDIPASETAEVKADLAKNFREIIKDRKLKKSRPKEPVSERDKYRDATNDPADPANVTSLPGNPVIIPEKLKGLVDVPIKRVNERIEASRGISKESPITKLAEGAKGVKDSFFRKFVDLDASANRVNAIAQDLLRRHETSDGFARAVTTDFLQDVTSGFDKPAYKLFTNSILFKDLIREVRTGKLDNIFAKGKDVNFGVRSKKELEEIVKHFDDTLNRPEFAHVKAAIDTRNDFIHRLRDEAIEWKVLGKGTKDVDDYFHRQVLEIFNRRVGMSGGIKGGKSGEQLRRKANVFDYNTDYFEPEFEVISNLTRKIDTAKTIRQLKDVADEGPKLRVRANTEILNEFPDLVKELKATHGKKWRTSEKYKKIIKPEINERLSELIRSSPNDLVKFTPRDSAHMRRMWTLEETIMEKFFKDGGGLQEADFKKFAVRTQAAEWIIPDGIAKTLSKDPGQLSNIMTARRIDLLVRGSLNAWKKWILISPARVLKYNLNNMSGDFDIAFTYNPKIVLGMKKAARDLSIAARSFDEFKGANIRFRKKLRNTFTKEQFKEVKDEIRQAIRLGAVDAGFVAADLKTINKIGFERFIRGEKPQFIRSVMRSPIELWEKSVEFTNWRENILRLAAFRHFKAEIKAGKKVYGASNKTQVDAITNTDEKAAKLARELMGDYGNISEAGQYLRTHMIPFYSWIEINAPRYVRMFKNLKHEGTETTGSIGAKASLIAFKKTSIGTAKWVAKYQMFFGLVDLANKARFPEEERMLSQQLRGQKHLILRRKADGTVQTLRIQGAFNDAIDWFGLADFAHDVEDVYREVKRGVKSTGEIARDVLVDTLIKGPVNKIVGSITPFFKTSAELLFKRSLYPDAFNARPLRDRWEHAASSVALTIPFKAAAGRPTGGFFNQIQGVVVNTYDPGEQQYHTSVNRVFKFLKDKGKDTGARSPSKRSNALFYWRKSLALGEPEKADKFIELYIELSEKEKIKDPGAGIRNVIKNLNPLNRIPENLRQEFKNEMDVKDLRALEDGQAWVKRVFDPKKVQAITPIKKKKR